MTTPDELGFDRATARISRNILWIGGLGSLSAWGMGGWKWGAGFLLGAIVGWFNYRWLKRLVEGLGGGNRPSAGLLGLRYLLLGGGSYVILRYSSISVPALITGMLVFIAAIFVEIIFELMYARKRTLDHQDL